MKKTDILSFVRRQGRLTQAQQTALNAHRDFILPANTPLDQQAVFARQAPLVLEIGFGNGTSLVEMAASNAEQDYIGIEVYRSGVGQCLRQLHVLSLSNLRLYTEDAMQIMTRCLQPASIARVQLFFPDPWPKKKHHKRRLVRPALLAVLRDILQPGAFVHFASDWQPYAEWTTQVFAQASDFVAIAYDVKRWPRPQTKFELRGQGLGHKVVDLVFQFCPA